MKTNDVFVFSQAHWCLAFEGPKFGGDINKICQAAKAGGCQVIDLVPEELRWAVVSAGLRVGTDLPPLGPPPFGPSLAHADTLVRAEIFKTLEARLRGLGVYNRGRAPVDQIGSMIVFAGLEQDNDGTTREEAADLLVTGFTDLSRVADQVGVDLLLEPLNVAVQNDPWRGHPGYFGPRADWCAEVVRRVRTNSTGSISQSRMWLLPDLYHIGYEEAVNPVDVMERDWDIIGRVHVAGVYPQTPRFSEGQVPTRSEPVLPGQQVDIAGALAALACKRQAAGVSSPITVLLEYIPYELGRLVENMQATINLCGSAL